MAAIDITRNHTLGKAAVKEKVNQVIERIKGETGLQGAWNGDVFKITKPADGSFTITDTTVHVVVDLPFMLRPLKGKVEERINNELNRALA
jgi:putative polyhydroxyalkanoate system protein